EIAQQYFNSNSYKIFLFLRNEVGRFPYIKSIFIFEVHFWNFNSYRNEYWIIFNINGNSGIRNHVLLFINQRFKFLQSDSIDQELHPGLGATFSFAMAVKNA